MSDNASSEDNSRRPSRARESRPVSTTELLVMVRTPTVGMSQHGISLRQRKVNNFGAETVQARSNRNVIKAQQERRDYIFEKSKPIILPF